MGSASPHLRDALKSNRNFRKLLADLQNHISTQNIDLTRLAPYRYLLNWDDRKLETEQGVRFERVASSR
jgi:hypothetical protein